MLQITVSVASLQNGSRNAVSGTGMTSMSDSLMACQPRMLEPSKPRPSSKTDSSRASAGMVKCCQRPGKSMNRRSTARTSFSRMSASTSFGVMDEPFLRRDVVGDAGGGSELPDMLYPPGAQTQATAGQAP